MRQATDIPPRGLDRALFGFLAAVALLLFVLAGCSQTRTVTVPAQESSVRVEAPDTTWAQEIPPPPPRGEVTQPETVILYGDTTRPTFEVSLLEVDRTDPEDQAVRLRVEQGSMTVEKQIALPPVGEGLRVQKSDAADTAATNRPRDHPGLEETIFGAPTDQQVEARVGSIERPWYQKVQRQLRLLIAFVGGMAFGYVATKLIPGL